MTTKPLNALDSQQQLDFDRVIQVVWPGRKMKYIIALLSLCMVGCAEPNPPPIEEVSAWFDKNYELLSELKEIGKKHPALRRAEPTLKKYTDYYGNPTDKDKIAEKRVFEIVDQLEVDFVTFSRTYPDFKDLSFMSVPAYRWGLCPGGVSTMVVYVDDKESIKRILANGHNTKFTPLNKDGWYIEESDTR